MLAPEVWSFSVPSSKAVFKEIKNKDEDRSDDIVSSHSFNHMVSVVIPDTLSVPSSILSALLQDCDYYRVSALPLVELIERNFLDAFIRRGQLTLLTENTRIDVDDTVGITPSGWLLLSLSKKTYQELGLEGRPSFLQRHPDKYIIQLDLKSHSFRPGKKNYERVMWCFKNQSHLKFDVLVVWNPPDGNICPSSVAAYFAHKGYYVHLCGPSFSRRISYDIPVPTLTSSEEQSPDYFELIEWLGAFSLGVNMDVEPQEDFLTTYRVPENCKHMGQVAYLSWTGFFSVQSIRKLVQILKSYTEERKNLCWSSISVQGFVDGPTSWGLKEHGFFTNGENHYTLFIRDSKVILTCELTGTRKKLKH